MLHKQWMGLLTLSILLGTVAGSSGQQADAFAPRLQEPERDPFRPPPDLREAEGQRQGAISGLPRMNLRGWVQDGDGVSLALLEIDGEGTIVVREGEELRLHLAGTGVPLRIREIGPRGLVLEVGEERDEVVVR